MASRRSRLGDRLRRVEERRQFLGRFPEYRTSSVHQKGDEGPPEMVSGEETGDAVLHEHRLHRAGQLVASGAANANERVRDSTAFVALCAEHLGQQEAAAQLADICAARVLRLRPPGPKAMT